MDDTVVKLTFELFPGRTLTLLPYEGVTNAREVFETLRAGKLADTGFFNPLYILSARQIQVAANKALYYQATGAMITKEITTETLHAITGQRNIGLSLKEFGIRDDRPQFIAFIFDATDAHIERIRTLVKGNAVSLTSDAFKALSNEATITKHYKVDKPELELGSLEDAVINRIVVRDI